jgi:hypothetical protein
MALPTEDELKTALDGLEQSTIRKGGDALQNAPHDGGFATQGTNIQTKTAIKKATATFMAKGMNKADAKKAAQELVKALMTSDDEDSDDDAAKAFGNDDASSDAESDAGGSDDDSSSDDDAAASPMSKSTGASQLAGAGGGGTRNGDSLRKALTDENPDAGTTIDAVPILGQLIDSIDRMTKRGGATSPKALGEIRKSLADLHSVQNSFNGRVAKALVLMGARVISTEAMVKKIHDEPVNAGNRTPTLRKGELRDPPLHDNDTQRIEGGAPSSPLGGVEYLKVQGALVDLCMKGLADPMDITKFENSKGNFALLPANVVKQLEQRLCPAA